jgi:hypothetical protein
LGYTIDIAKWIWDIDKNYFDSHKKEWNDSLDKNNEYGHMIFSSELLNDAITHIIVDKDKRIPDVINYIMNTPVRDNREPYTIIKLRVYASSPTPSGVSYERI